MLLTLNVSPYLLLDGPVRELVESVELHGIVFELTEHSVPPDPDDLVPITNSMRARGALIALDDAGSGYQASSRSRRCARTGSRSTVRTSPVSRPTKYAAPSLVMFDRVARRVGALTVAEGVESTEDLDALRELNIALAQGFWLGTPTMHPRVRRPAARRA